MPASTHTNRSLIPSFLLPTFQTELEGRSRKVGKRPRHSLKASDGLQESPAQLGVGVRRPPVVLRCPDPQGDVHV